MNQNKRNILATGRHKPVCSLLASVECLPLGERRWGIRFCHPSQFYGVLSMSLAGHVFCLLQSVRLLLAQRQLP